MMKPNIFPSACAVAENHRLHGLKPTPPRRRAKNPAAALDYFVSVGSTTFQVSITSSNGVRRFRLKHAARLAI